MEHLLSIHTGSGSGETIYVRAWKVEHENIAQEAVRADHEPMIIIDEQRSLAVVDDTAPIVIIWSEEE
jgi:hypothetical protein